MEPLFEVAIRQHRHVIGTRRRFVAAEQPAEARLHAEQAQEVARHEPGANHARPIDAYPANWDNRPLAPTSRTAARNDAMERLSQRRTKPTISLMAFMVSPAITSARDAPAASTLSI